MYESYCFAPARLDVSDGGGSQTAQCREGESTQACRKNRPAPGLRHRIRHPAAVCEIEDRRRCIHRSGAKRSGDPGGQDESRPAEGCGNPAGETGRSAQRGQPDSNRRGCAGGCGGEAAKIAGSGEWPRFGAKAGAGQPVGATLTRSRPGGASGRGRVLTPNSPFLRIFRLAFVRRSVYFCYDQRPSRVPTRFSAAEPRI